MFIKNTENNPPQDHQTETYPKKSVSSPGQFSSGIASLFLDMTPAVMLAVATVSTWFGPTREVKNTFKFEKLASHEMADIKR